MELAIIYRRNTDQERPIIEFKEMMRRRYPDKKIVEYDLDTREGADKALFHGIVRYPAVLVTSTNGSVQGLWEGEPLPLIDEVFGAMLEHRGV